MGIYILNIKNKNGNKSNKGDNPFAEFTIGNKKLSSIVKCHNSSYTKSANVYDDIKNNIEEWVEQATKKRKLIFNCN
jgi:hypothetical protein